LLHLIEELKRRCGKELQIKSTANANNYQHRVTVKAHIQVREMNDFVSRYYGGRGVVNMVLFVMVSVYFHQSASQETITMI
jgi:hypothetical protein